MKLTPDNLELAAKAAYERNFRNGAWDIQPTQCEKNDWRDAVEAALASIPEPGPLTDESLKTYARARADECYLDMIAQARTDACCGWEHKAQCGEFGPREFEAHKKAAEHYGKHLAYADIAVVLSRHPAPAPEPDSAFGTMVDEARIPQPTPQQDDAVVVEEVWRLVYGNQRRVPLHPDHIANVTRAIEFIRRGMVPRTEGTYTLDEVEKAMRNVNQTGWVVDENDRVKRVLARLTAALKPTKQERHEKPVNWPRNWRKQND